MDFSIRGVGAPDAVTTGLDLMVEPEVVTQEGNDTVEVLNKAHWVSLHPERHHSDEKIRTAVRQLIQRLGKPEERQGAPSLIGPVFAGALGTIANIIESIPASDWVAALNILEVVVNNIVASATQQPLPTSTNTTELFAKDAYADTQTALAQYIYLLDNVGPKLADIFSDPNDVPGCIQAISDQFSAKMTAAKSGLDSLAAKQAAFGIQDPSLFSGFQLPKFLARTLIASTGYFNIDLADSAKALLFNSQHFDYQDEIERVLNCYKTNTQMSDSLGKTSKPASESAEANTLIRTTLGISPNDPVTDVDAKRCHLAAMLSKPRQGNIGSCFATSITIEVHDLRPDKEAADYAYLLKNDCLKRSVDGDVKTILYPIDANDSSLEQTIKVAQDGTIGGGNIADVPAFRAACQAMGINEANHQTAILQAVSTLAQTAGSTTLSVSPATIITQIAANDPAKMHLGYLGFCSMVNNPLRRAWEECVAAMAEVRPTSLVRGKIISCIKLPLSNSFTTNVTEASIAKKVQDCFFNTLNKQIVIEYDPNTSTGTSSQITGDGHSNNDAAFILKGVTNPQEFQQFVLNTLKITDATIRPQLAGNTSALDKIITKVTNVVQTNDFLKSVITNFDSENQQATDPVQQWNELEYLPWRAQYGNDPFEVSRVYFEQANEDVDTFTVQNAKDLWTQILAKAKAIQKETHYIDNKTIEQRYEMASPQHAFTWILDHESFVVGVLDKHSASRYVTNYAKKHGMVTSSLPVNQDERAEIIKLAAKLLPKHLIVDFIHDAERFAHETVGELRNHLLTLLHDIAGPEDHIKAETSRRLDHIIMNHGLSQGSRDAIKPLIVHFADTNWNDGDHGIDFCFYPSPSGEILFGMVYDNGTNLMPIDQGEWVLNQQWQISNRPINTAS